LGYEKAIVPQKQSIIKSQILPHPPPRGTSPRLLATVGGHVGQVRMPAPNA